MSIFTSLVRGFNEDRFWKYYKRSRSGCRLKRLAYSVLYMRMATKQSGYVGRGTVFEGKPHFPPGLHGVHISRLAHIGNNVTIFQNVTIGRGDSDAATITIGDNVMIGANAVVIAPVYIGANVKIGAGAIVLGDIPSNSTVVSEKARIIHKEE